METADVHPCQWSVSNELEIDHSVPPDVSWANFCDYIGYLKHRLGRG